MSTSDRLMLVLHIGFAIFTLGPLTAATHATPRYIRKRDVGVVRYLNRATRLYALGTLGILLFGIILAKGDFARVWLTVSITLFVVALVLLLIVERDQRKAIHLLEAAPAPAVPVAVAKGEDEDDEEGRDEKVAGAPAASDIAQVERGRIASLSGVISLIWLVSLVLMVWNGS
ncbi:hypothetical protein [Spirillospora sp. CA-294931]|uniref:hypothetical protein n=1 Tax=Spirillospora sp. CA-294931 TaxID=3240042 RepID=UPI003D89D2F1